MATFETIIDFVASILVFIIILYLFFGQKWQDQKAMRQMKEAERELENYRSYGLRQIINTVSPLTSEVITEHDIREFALDMLEFFVIPPTEFSQDTYHKLSTLISQREERYHELIRNFIPAISESDLCKISALLIISTDIDKTLKQIRHSLLVSKKSRSYLFLLQNASETTQELMKAKTLRLALDTFAQEKALGDSIGPLAVKQLVNTLTSNIADGPPNSDMLNGDFLTQTIFFEERQLFCMRAKGPENRTGNPNKALQHVMAQIIAPKKQVKLVITIDAYAKLEVEKTGTVAHGLGVALGSEYASNLDKAYIESFAIAQDPPIQLESVICRESVVEAVMPMTEQIQDSIPQIIRVTKQIIRTRTQPGDIIFILGIGNALGVPP